MYFYAVWTYHDHLFEGEIFPVMETKLSRKEWRKRLAKANYVPNHDEDCDTWKFFYNDTDFIDAWEWYISPTLYLTEKLAREASAAAYAAATKRGRRLRIRDASKRSRIQNKSN